MVLVNYTVNIGAFKTHIQGSDNLYRHEKDRKLSYFDVIFNQVQMFNGGQKTWGAKDLGGKRPGGKRPGCKRPGCKRPVGKSPRTVPGR